MISKTHLILIAIVGLGLLIGGISYTSDLRDKLTLANQQVNDMEAKIKAQQVLSSAMNVVSTLAVQSKQDLANDENQTKEIVRTIIKDSDCTNALVPIDASNRLRDYANRIRDPTSAH